MEEQGCRMPWLAKQVGVSVQSIWFWKNGTHKPNPYYIEKIAKALRTTSEYLTTHTTRCNPQAKAPRKTSKLAS